MMRRHSGSARCQFSSCFSSATMRVVASRSACSCTSSGSRNNTGTALPVGSVNSSVAALSKLRQPAVSPHPTRTANHNLIGLQGADLYPLIPQSMQRQYRLLLFALHGHEAHVGPLYGLPDRLCIGRIGLVGLHERPHELRRNQLHLMTQTLQQSSPVVCRPQASIATTPRGARAKNVLTCARRNVLRFISPLRTSTQCT